MKIVDERGAQKATATTTKKQKAKQNESNEDRKEEGGTGTIVKRPELNDFVVHLN